MIWEAFGEHAVGQHAAPHDNLLHQYLLPAHSRRAAGIACPRCHLVCKSIKSDLTAVSTLILASCADLLTSFPYLASDIELTSVFRSLFQAIAAQLSCPSGLGDGRPLEERTCRTGRNSRCKERGVASNACVADRSTTS